MKIDKLNASHWIYLLRSAVNVLVARSLRPWQRRPEKPVVLLYGHKLNGNLLAIYRAHRLRAGSDLQIAFLTMDPGYHASLTAQGYESRCLLDLRSIRLLASASAIVSDHGLHTLEFLLGVKNLRFFDVWHGIPFKGFDAEDFRIQHRYNQTWVASDLVRKLYVERFGFDEERVVITGYARTDQLVQRPDTLDAIRTSLGIPKGRKAVLFAPTWAQDDKGRNIFPFGAEEAQFLGALSAIAAEHGAVILLRSHLNTGEAAATTYPHVMQLPSARYPDAEAILQVSDCLVCDWSSIAFDYLLLDRPAIFLDVPPPFRKGFSLGPEYRYGAVVSDMETLQVQLRAALQSPDHYWQQHGQNHQKIKREIYGAHADGKAAERCLAQLAAATREFSR